jgi:hypothetical protein
MTNYDTYLNGVNSDNAPTPTHYVPFTTLNPAKFGTGLQDPSTGQPNPFAYNNGRYFSASMGIKF